MPRTKRPVSIRWSLLRSFALLIVLTSMTVLVTMWLEAPATEQHLSQEMIGRGVRQARRELDRFLEPASKGTAMAAAWGRAGLLDLTPIVRCEAGADTQVGLAAAGKLNALLLPFLDAYPLLSSVQVATASGQGFLILRLPDGTVRNRVVCREGWGTQALWLDVDGDGVASGPRWEDVDYDPRTREWYTVLDGEDDGVVRWTRPYVFFTTKDLGITASAKWQDDGVTTVVAWDVMLTTLTEFTQDRANQATPSAQTLIATSDWHSLGLPGLLRREDPAELKALFLKPPRALGLPLFADAAAAVNAAMAPEDDEPPAVIRFESEDEAWWAGVRRYVLDHERTLWIATLVPNSELLEALTKQRNVILLATAAALLAALLYALLLARAYSRPLEALARQSRKIRDMDFEAGEPIHANLKEIHELAEAHEQSLRAVESFSRYVPMGVVRDLVDAGEVARIGGRTMDLTVLFTDIEGFTRISEAMTPEDLTAHMAQYFEGMIDTLRETGATVDKMVGDAIVAFWGAPRPFDDHVQRAVRGVLACRRLLEEKNPAWVAAGRPALPTRFGLASGPVVVGNIGSPSRLAYTALGDTMNFASRLEALNKEYGSYLLADAVVHALCRETHVWRRLDRTVVVGKTEPQWIYELLGAHGDVPPEVVATARAYEAAWDAYAARDFPAAIARLDDLLAKTEDAASRRLHDLATAYRADPPPPEWDGTTRMAHK